MRYLVTAPKSLTQPLCVGLPASKSLSNRALIMQGLCRDHCRLTNISDCDDTRVMLKAFDKDSSKYCYADDGAHIVDIGAAGTSMRFLTALSMRCANSVPASIMWLRMAFLRYAYMAGS